MTTELDPGRDDAEALAALAEAIRRLPDAVLEEALYAALGAALKRRGFVTTADGTKAASVSAPSSSDAAAVSNADVFVRLIAEHLPAEVTQAVRPAWAEKFLEGLAEGVHRFVTGGHDSMAAAYRAGLLAHLDMTPVLATDAKAA